MAIASAKIDTAGLNSQIKRLTRTLAQETIPGFKSKLGGEILRRVVLRSPVDTGNYRAHWTMEIDGEDVEVINAAHYAIHLEFGTKHMAPRLVATKAVEEVRDWVSSGGVDISL